MRPGIFAKTFADGSLESALDAVRASGLDAIQFNLALACGQSLPDELPKGLVARIRGAVRSRGLDMVALSGTYNMAHPDRRARETGLEALSAVIASAPELGTRIVTLCTGSRDRSDMWRWHPGNGTASAWADMSASIAAAVQVAEAHGVILGFEPEQGNVVADARAGRRLLDEVSSSHLKVVIDAANLMRPGRLSRQDEILEEAFELLGDEIALAHAKDLLEDGSVVPAGTGELHYERYLSLLGQCGYGGAVVLHGLKPCDVAYCSAFLRSHLGEHQPEVC